MVFNRRCAGISSTLTGESRILAGDQDWSAAGLRIGHKLRRSILLGYREWGRLAGLLFAVGLVLPDRLVRLRLGPGR